jgi:hypothetical protein
MEGGNLGPLPCPSKSRRQFGIWKKINRFFSRILTTVEYSLSPPPPILVTAEDCMGFPRILATAEGTMGFPIVIEIVGDYFGFPPYPSNVPTVVTTPVIFLRSVMGK